MKYRLNKAETVQTTINNVASTKKLNNGREIVTYSNYIRLIPGRIYETEDKAMIEFFKSYTRKVRHTAGIEEALKSANVPYKIEFCRSCGGRVKKISYKVVEVLDDEIEQSD